MKHYKKIDKAYLNDAGFESRKNKKIEYLVIHYTAGSGDRAESVARYFKTINQNKSRYASAHYIVDNNSVWQSVADNMAAWHCGGNKYIYSSGGSFYGKCTNLNSLGIEMCNCLKSLDYVTLENTIALAKDLVKKYNIQDKNIIRHYDVTGKHCPAFMIDDDPDKKNNWKLFKSAIITGDKYYIKIDKSGNIFKRLRTGEKWVKMGQFK